MKVFWVSCNQFTVRVACDNNGVIREAAPLVRRFIGQHFDNLWSWATKLGGLRVVPFPQEDNK